MHFPTRFTALLAAALASSCAGLDVATAPKAGVRAVGILAWDGRTGAASPQADRTPGLPRPGVYAPDTVPAGTSFPVVVVTVGPTVCWLAAGAQLEMQPAVAAVTPIDSTPEDDWTSCGDSLVELSRVVSVTFPEPGEAVLRVHGRRVVGNFQAEEKIVLERKVHVR